MGAAKMTHNRSFQAFMNKPIVGQLGPSTGHAGALNGNPAGETKSNLQNKRRRAYTEAEKAEFAVLRRENIALMNAQSVIDAAAKEAKNAERNATRRRYTYASGDELFLEDRISEDMALDGIDISSEGGNNNDQCQPAQHRAGQRSTDQRSAGRTATYPF